jgi:methylglutaconyl-CoA hydratase
MAAPLGLRIRDERKGTVVRLTLDRPTVHNALDERLVGALLDALARVAADPLARVVVLEGDGPSFCAGADIGDMRASLALDEAGNREGAIRLATLYRRLDSCPVPVVSLVHGAVLGGGVGLVAASDHVIATSDTHFGLTETRLGILPAVIAPYVVGRIGPGAARSLVLTGRRFDAAEALRLGLVHALVDDVAALVESGRSVIDSVLAGGPNATRLAKGLVREMASTDTEAMFERTVELIAGQRVSHEGQEGLRAFLEKRRPDWRLDD